MFLDYYEILEINRSATDADIKNAYRRLAVKFHPTCNKDAGSIDRFCLLGEAYEVLSDLQKKALYDKFGGEGLKGGAPLQTSEGVLWSAKYTYHNNPEKTFKQFFGSNNPYSALFETDGPLQYCGRILDPVPTQDPPIEKELPLSLEDLFHGRKKKINISRKVMNEDSGTSCIKDKILTINVEPGWTDGTRVVFSKEGDQGPYKIPADIIFIIREKSHPQFTREGNDLIYKSSISLEKALTGCSVEVETLDGRQINIPINDIVHPAYRKVVAGEGMPHFQDPARRGDLILTFDIQFPKSLSYERREQIRQALKCS
ncbi:dnaJ homolog subfamily B member 13-like [Synchiropus picturatus]